MKFRGLGFVSLPGWNSHLHHQAAQRSCGCPIRTGDTDQVEWGPGQPDLIDDLTILLTAGGLELCGLSGLLSPQLFYDGDEFGHLTSRAHVSETDSGMPVLMFFFFLPIAS